MQNLDFTSFNGKSVILGLVLVKSTYMKAIILASGRGIRLGSITQDMPKTLIKILDRPIIERILDSLLEFNIKTVIITTGFHADKLKAFIMNKEKYRRLKIEYVHNSKYKETNYIYTLWLLREKIIDDDIILIHGDVVCDSSLLKKLIKMNESHVTVSKKDAIEPHELKAQIKNDKVVYIGLHPADEKTMLCTSIFKLLKKDIKIWMDEIDVFVNQGIVGCYAEDAFNKVSDKMTLLPLVFENEVGMDIDRKEDIKTAERLLKS